MEALNRKKMETGDTYVWSVVERKGEK